MNLNSFSNFSFIFIVNFPFITWYIGTKFFFSELISSYILINNSSKLFPFFIDIDIFSISGLSFIKLFIISLGSLFISILFSTIIIFMSEYLFLSLFIYLIIVLIESRLSLLVISTRNKAHLQSRKKASKIVLLLYIISSSLISYKFIYNFFSFFIFKSNWFSLTTI